MLINARIYCVAWCQQFFLRNKGKSIKTWLLSLPTCSLDVNKPDAGGNTRMTLVLSCLLLSLPSERSEHWRRLRDWSFCSSFRGCFCMSVFFNWGSTEPQGSASIFQGFRSWPVKNQLACEISSNNVVEIIIMKHFVQNCFSTHSFLHRPTLLNYFCC